MHCIIPSGAALSRSWGGEIGDPSLQEGECGAQKRRPLPGA